MRDYVVGFGFCNGHVALIEKKRGPAYVVGTWNGIGGKIEHGEGPRGAMVREFEEETGLKTDMMQWNYFSLHKGTGADGEPWRIWFYWADIDPGEQFLPHIECKEAGGEWVLWYRQDLMDCKKPTPNLKWIIPLALDKTTGVLEIQEH